MLSEHNSGEHFSYCFEQVKRHDYGRYICTLLMTERAREVMIPLFALNTEIAAVGATVSEPMIGLIRLAWWKEGIEDILAGSPPREHPVLKALAPLIDRQKFDVKWLHAIFSGREQDLSAYSFARFEDLEQYCDKTSSALLVIAAEMLGISDHTTHNLLSTIGRSWAISGLLRSIPHFAAHGKNILPEDILKAHEITADDVINGKHVERVCAAILAVAQAAKRVSDVTFSVHSPEIRQFRVFHAHSNWWLNRIISMRGNVFHPSINNGKILLLSRLWFESWR